MILYWKRDISLLKKRRKSATYKHTETTHFDYDFYGFGIKGFFVGFMIKTGES